MEDFRTPRRKQPIHFVRDRVTIVDSVYLITVCTKDRKKILANGNSHDLLVAAWKEADHWLVGPYVIMPDHIHLICCPATLDSLPLTTWIKYWKSLTSRSWQIQEQKPIWQQQYWDTRIRKHKMSEKWMYVELNPVRHKLVELASEWPYQGCLNDIS